MAKLALRRIVAVRYSLLGLALLGAFSVAWLRDPLQLLYARARAPVVTRTVNTAGLQIPSLFEGAKPLPPERRRTLGQPPPVLGCRKQKNWADRIIAILRPTVHAEDLECKDYTVPFDFCLSFWSLRSWPCYYECDGLTWQLYSPGYDYGVRFRNESDPNCSFPGQCECLKEPCPE